ncbi:hypothetical protein KO506_14860 [Polaribacter vadi]|uniref:hypothetical protein n=1 Tax=Polaribacter TaxID=52959 RepID=UPI001C08433B|nr:MULTISPECIES: hypothetical protein [Polaribacter]MBU3012692.1 hypothetical protein [Polaribacter vadi]MDO6742509.1 hypothetical protein [Polaribacter sp. 1_MG-2023]
MKRILFLLIILISCTNSETETEIFPISIEFTEIGKGTLTGSGFENIIETKTIIKNNEDWNNLVAKMNTIENVSNEFNTDEINFDTHYIVAIILELKGTGWTVEINEMIENSENIIVNTEEVDFSTLAYSQPFHIVLIPKTEKEIIFE